MSFLCPMFPRRRKKRKGNDAKSTAQNGAPVIRISSSNSEDSLVRNTKGEDPEEIDFEPRKMVVLHDFIPCVEDEIAVKRGEYVKGLYQETDWIYIINSRNKEGFIPFTYCISEDEYEKRKEKQRATGLSRKNYRNASFMDSIVAQDETTVSSFPKINFGEFVVRFDFDASAEDDISAKKGDVVIVLNKDDLDWYWVAKRNGHEGFIPKDFLTKADQLSLRRSSNGDTGSKSSRSSTTTSSQNSPSSPTLINNSTVTPYTRILDTPATRMETMAIRTNTMATRMDTMATRTNAMATRVDTMVTPKDTMDTSIDAMATRMNDLTMSGHNSGSKVNTSFSRIDATMATRMDPMATSMKTEATKLENMGPWEDTMTTRMGTMAIPVDTMATRMGTMTTPVDTMATRMGTMATPVDTMATRMGTMATPMDTKVTRMNGSASRVNSTPHAPLAYQPATASRLGNPGTTNRTNRRNSNDLMIYGQELVCIDTYNAQQSDELTVFKGDWVYADMKHKDHRGWIWACSPTSNAQGFVPKACLRPPATTPL